MSSKQNDRHIIWSDIHLDFEDWRADLEEQYPDLSEDELIQKMYEINSDYLGDERMNLNVQLSQPILVVADIGRWDGRYDGYAEIKTGNIKDCLYSEMDMCEWYVDKYGDLRADAVHHDGTNHYLYRVYKDTATDSQIENLKARLLGREHISTSEQLFSYKSKVEDEIKTLSADRTHLRNEIRKVNIDDDLLSGKRQQISALSERLKELRKEVRLCDGIAERSGVMRENLNAVLADEEKIKNNRKENRDYEHRR